MSVATRIVSMEVGHIRHVGTLAQHDRHPANTFVAMLNGAPFTG
ncbi:MULTISPECIES: hypothetical protein [Jannaschia]|nr:MULTISPECIES: hypothetical protein [unclassified Jannaschia]